MKAGVEGNPAIYTTMGTLGNHTGSWRFMRPDIALRPAPCSDACPVGNPISRFMMSARSSMFKESLRLIKEESPMPAVCGRVCPHPCISVCNRGEFDEPLTINEVERVIGDASRDYGLQLPGPAASSGKKIVVVGAGPAGLGCAYHAALLGHDVTIFERCEVAGGLLRYGIPEYRLPRDVVDMELGFIKEFGIKISAGSEISEKEIIEGFSGRYDAVCVGIGAGESSRLALEGDNAGGVIPGLEFLKAVNAGEHTAPGKKVLVIGGGNTAMDAARCAVRLGADVTVCYRRGENEMPAFADEIREAREEGVKFEYLAAPIKIKQNGSTVSSVTFNRMKLDEVDGGGRRRPVPVDGETFEMEADAVLTAIGESVESAFKGLTAGAKKTDQNIYVAGDAGSGDRTVAHALGSGKKCAIMMDAAMRGLNAADELEKVMVGNFSISSAMYRAQVTGNRKTVSFGGLNTAYFKKAAAVHKMETAPDERIKDFREINEGLPRDKAVGEAYRCFTCGCCDSCGNCHLFCPDMSIVKDGGAGTPSFKGDYCKGCGICAKECPRGVIEMVEDEK